MKRYRCTLNYIHPYDNKLRDKLDDYVIKDEMFVIIETIKDRELSWSLILSGFKTGWIIHVPNNFKEWALEKS